jgi:hypothetical protein
MHSSSSQIFEDVELEENCFRFHPNENFNIGNKMKFDSSKDNIDDFFRKFTIICKLNNFSIQKQMKELLLSLDSASFILLLQHPNFERMVEQSKIQEIVDYLSNRFSRKNNLSYKLELNNLIQNFNESIEGFATRLLNSLKKAYPANYVEMGNLIGKNIFLKGIKDVIIRNKLLKVIENNSFDDIIKLAMKLELFQEQSNLLTQNFNNINLNTNEVNAFSADFGKMVANRNNRVTENKMEKSNIMPDFHNFDHFHNYEDGSNSRGRVLFDYSKIPTKNFHGAEGGDNFINSETCGPNNCIASKFNHNNTNWRNYNTNNQNQYRNSQTFYNQRNNTNNRYNNKHNFNNNTRNNQMRYDNGHNNNTQYNNHGRFQHQGYNNQQQRFNHNQKFNTNYAKPKQDFH